MFRLMAVEEIEFLWITKTSESRKTIPTNSDRETSNPSKREKIVGFLIKIDINAVLKNVTLTEIGWRRKTKHNPEWEASNSSKLTSKTKEDYR